MEHSTPSAPPPEPPSPAMSPLLLAMVGMGLTLSLFLTVGGGSQLLNPAFGLWFTEVFVFLGVAWVLLRASRYEPVSYTGLRFTGAVPAAFGFALGVANFFALVVPIQYTAQSLAPEWLREMFDGSRLFENQSPLELAILLAGVSIAAPVCEEFFFRGVLQKGVLTSFLSRLGAVVVTAVVFSAFHLDPVGFVARVELGVLFGLLRLYTGSLWPSILAHSANNVVSSILFLVARQMGGEAADERPPLPIVLIVMTVGLLALGSLLLLARRYPALWGAREEAPTVTQLSPSPLRLVLPWVVGATVSLGILGLVDPRGIRLNLVDMQHKLPRLPKGAPDALHAERARLQQLRQEARSGRVPVEAYEEERLRQARQHRQ